MEARRLLSSLLIITVATSQLLAAPPPDTEATTLLVGSWVVPHDQFTVLSKDGCITFRSDGTFSLHGVFRVRDEDLRMELQGKWSVKNAILIEELTTSSEPRMAPVGWVTRDTLLAVTDKEYRFQTDQKMEYTYVRKGKE